MHAIETDSTMQIGRLVRAGRNRWRATCKECWAVAIVRIRGDYREAAVYLRDDGWTETHGIWTCPECSREGAGGENDAARVRALGDSRC